ncbi:MAG: hypothetical protein Q4C55_08445 [Eubacterium sp.]|nr:hypothetical protein [Eubacterium sp.]
MEEKIVIYLGAEGVPLEFITLEPIGEDTADYIAERAEIYFKDVELESMGEHLIEDRLEDFYEEIWERLEVQLFCPRYEKENIASIEKILEDY